MLEEVVSLHELVAQGIVKYFSPMRRVDCWKI